MIRRTVYHIRQLLFSKKSFLHGLQRVAIICLTLSLIHSANAHEFWLEPEKFDYKQGEKAQIDIKIGQDFKANGMSYLPQNIVLNRLHTINKTADLNFLMGDRPALTPILNDAGLNIISYVSTAQKLNFKEYSKFTDYLKAHGQDSLISTHNQRQLPKENIIESYQRASKTLINVGMPYGSDKKLGLPLEFVLEINPYKDDNKEIPVTLYWQGEPLKQTEIHIFQRNQLTYFAKIRTDDNGRAIIPVNCGGIFMINAVHLYEPDQDIDAHWASYWGSTTFEVKRTCQ